MTGWPKKMPIGDFSKRWYTSRTNNSIINDIQSGKLPGIQDPGGHWYVWVNSDFTPAHAYQEPAKVPSSGAILAQKILEKRGSLRVV